MRTLLAIVLLVLVCYIVILLVYRKPVELKIEPKGEDNYKANVLTVTEAGTKVYRVDGPKLIVPLIIVESKTGQVAIR